jgi:hypothetical protein
MKRKESDVTDTRIAAATAAAASPIETAGAAWMLHPEQFEASLSSGYDHPFSGHFAGRGGMLGEAPTEVVASVLYHFPLEVTTLFWEAGKPVHGGTGGADLYHQQAAEWAARHLDGVAGLDRFAELGEKIIAAAPRGGLPIFAGWAAKPRVSDPAGHAFQVLLVLRELRGGIHMAALANSGISPKEAHLLNNPGNCPGRPAAGPDYAGLFGFAEPWPDVSHLKAVREEVEETTSRRMNEVVAAALTAEEAEEFSALAQAINAKLCG